MDILSRRANTLSGKDWLKNSISIWGDDIVKTKDEKTLKHPALFPESLVSKLLASFLNGFNKCVLDPFLGSGSTLVAACKLQHYGLGFEIYKDFIDIAKKRLESFDKQYAIYNDSALNISKYLEKESVDIVITSPPYWNILNRKRTADAKNIRTYGNNDVDLGNIENYEEFIGQLINIIKETHTVLKPKSYCIINIMDIRVKDRLYTLHSDIYAKLQLFGFKLDDIIIWDRRRDYNNLRTLGYPYKFRINRVHEYLLIFQRD
jgi:DNA modification methylase